MAALLFICPKTKQQTSTGIKMDVQSLSASWKKMLKVNCPHCDEVHEISVRETYLDGALSTFPLPREIAEYSAPPCRFRELHPPEWRRQPNQNMIAVDDRN
jgi:hypothetical protein